MSLLIKGAEMPKNCAECRYSCKHYDCPLVEIKTLYGMQIDADALLEKVAEEYGERARDRLYQIIRYMPYMSSVCPDNQVHLCDSCSYTYPECPSEYTDMIFGNGIGNDNVCACSKYIPSAQPKKGKWNRLDMDTLNCNKCGTTFTLNQGSEKMHFCPNCGAKMEG